MTNPSLPDSPQSPNPRRRSRLPWRLLFLLALIGSGGLIYWAWYFVHEQLAPLVSDTLTKQLNRPVKIGALERISPVGLRFGPTELPATLKDKDWARAEAVEVGFDPWQLLWRRTIELKVTLVKPDSFFDETTALQWVDTQITPPAPGGPISIVLTELRLQEGKTELRPLPKKGQKSVSVRFQQLNGGVQLLEDNHRFKYDLTGQSLKQGNFKVQGETRNLASAQQPETKLDTHLSAEGRNFDAAEIDRLIRLPIDLNKGRVDGKVKLSLSPNQKLGIQGGGKFKNIDLVAAGSPKPILDAVGELELQDFKVTIKKVKAKFGTIPVTAKGTIDPKEGFNLQAKVASVTLATFFKAFDIKSPVPVSGEVAADILMQGPLATPTVSGITRNLKPITVDRVVVKTLNSSFSLDTASSVLRLKNAVTDLALGGQTVTNGTINLKDQRVDLSTRLVAVPGDAFAKLYNDGKALSITIGDVIAVARTTGTPDRIQTLVDWETPDAATPDATYAAKGQLLVAEGGDRLELRRMVAQGLGGSILAQGIAIKRQWNAQVQVAGVPLGQFDPQLRGVFNGNFKLNGSLDDFSPTAIRAEGTAQLSEGLTLVTDPIDAVVAWDGQQINLRSATAPGLQASGTIAVNLDDKPEITGLDLAVKTQGLLLSSLPLGLPTFAKVSGGADFDGRITGVPADPKIRGALVLPDLRANGLAFESLRGPVDIDLKQGIALDLAGVHDRLAFKLDSKFNPLSVRVVQGEVDVTGQRQGELFNVAIANFPLETLNGLELPIPALPQQVAGRLSGNLALNIPRQELARGTVRIDGPRFDSFQAQQILANLRYVGGIAEAGIAVDQASGFASGLAVNSARVTSQVRYQNGAASGTIALVAPKIGTFQGNDAKTSFTFGNNILRVAQAEISQGSGENLSRLALNNLKLDLNQARLQGEAHIVNANIQEILGGAQIFQIADLARGMNPPSYGKAADLVTLPVGERDAKLVRQVDRFSEVRQILAQVASRRSNLNLPELLDLRGRFRSDISFDAVLNGEINGTIDLTAQNVEWRPFPSYAEETGRGRNLNLAVNDNRTFLFDEVKIVADLDKGVLNLKPVQATLGEAVISIQGVVGGPNNDFKLTVAKLPIDQLRKFYSPPIALDGKLNAQLSVSKPLNNPDATGTISLVEGTLRNTPINSAELGFGYENGNINFGGAVVVANNPNPLEFKGDIPLPIPFLAIQPKSTEAQLNLKVEDDGLALINLFTDQVSWVGGKGKVDLNVRASLFPLAASVNGDITLNNVELASRAFPEKSGKTGAKETLTGINGRVKFENDRLRVTGIDAREEFVGQFSQGKVIAKGVLPLLGGFGEQDPDVGKGLDVTLQNIALTFKGLYQGGVDGDISVKGSAIAPRVGGEVRLSNGRVLLADTLPGADAAGDLGGEVASGDTGFQFSNLKITLGNNLRIVKAPIINFVARGDLLVNGGDLNRLSLGAPEGSTIELLSGQVNLFTTQFVLARGYRHRAVFRPELGPDPILDVRLISSVPEVSRSRVATNTLASEVNDGPLFATNLGSLQTVRIQAKVSGVASQLFQNLELTSSPGRTRNEIIGLIGGGFINTLGKGDSSLGIANLAGSALLTNIQGFIGNALGLSEFRLFPTITTDEDKQSSTLGLAAEAGFDITPAFSASILRVLTAGQGTQFGLRYRINDSYLFRGSTDFAGENRAVLEYETRF